MRNTEEIYKIEEESSIVTNTDHQVSANVESNNSSQVKNS